MASSRPHPSPAGSRHRRLHSDALQAHLPRKLIEEYDHLVLAALTSSKESLEAGGEGSVPRRSPSVSIRRSKLICDLL